VAKEIGSQTRYASMGLGDHSLAWSANGVSLPKSFFNSDTSAKVDVLRRGQRRSA